MRFRKRLWAACLTLLVLSVTLVGAKASWERTLRAIVQPYRFSLGEWYLRQLWALCTYDGPPPDAIENPSAFVEQYLALVALAQTLKETPEGVPAGLDEVIKQMEPVAERILARQVRAAYRAEGITHPFKFFPLPITFPPLWFVFEPPPHVLVVSPRERIEPIAEILLAQEMDLPTMERIESRVETLNLSALVTEIGGLAALYPAVVNPQTSLEDAIGTVAEEWLHQYLFFTPLGFRYALHLLGIAPNYEIAQINESLATIVQEEIRTRVLATEYGVIPSPEEEPHASGKAFDFRAFMRETRLQVEALLARGEIDKAEAYMESRRQILVAKGYRIRKLNQAYFAFHGTYADAPGAITPIGAELRALRAQSGSLKAFLEMTSQIRSREDLRNLLQKHGIHSVQHILSQQVA